MVKTITIVLHQAIYLHIKKEKEDYPKMIPVVVFQILFSSLSKTCPNTHAHIYNTNANSMTAGILFYSPKSP